MNEYFDPRNLGGIKYIMIGFFIVVVGFVTIILGFRTPGRFLYFSGFAVALFGGAYHIYLWMRYKDRVKGK